MVLCRKVMRGLLIAFAVFYESVNGFPLGGSVPGFPGGARGFAVHAGSGLPPGAIPLGPKGPIGVGGPNVAQRPLGGPGNPAVHGGVDGLAGTPSSVPPNVRSLPNPGGGFGYGGGHFGPGGRIVEDFGPPQPYNFQYAVNDALTGAAFNRHEDSDGSSVKGAYTVQLPDGRSQIVKYNADGTGFNADVQYEGEPTYPTYSPGSTTGNNHPGGFARNFGGRSGGFSSNGGGIDTIGVTGGGGNSSESETFNISQNGDSSDGFGGDSSPGIDGGGFTSTGGFAGGNSIGGSSGFPAHKFGK